MNILANSNPGGGADNDPPVADAGPDRSVTVGQSSTLDGSGSFDPNGDPLSYSWSLVSWPTGSTADFSNSTETNPVFMADIAGTFIAELLVHDGIIRSAADRVEIVATANTPPPPPPGQTFAELCQHPSVLRCVDFSDMGELIWSADGRAHPPAIDNEVFYEGDTSLRMTLDMAVNYNLSDTLSVSFPSVSEGSVFLSWRMRSQNLWPVLKNGDFTSASGMKFFQVTAGGQSCHATEITLADHFVQRNLTSTGALSLSHSCNAHLFGAGGDWQPGGTLGDCGASHFNAPGPSTSPPCHLLQDDTWHLLTLEIVVGGGVKLWIDKVLAIDSPMDGSGHVAPGPYARAWINNYTTGHQSGENAEDFPDGLARVWYDNLIISTHCVTGCGPGG